MRIDKKSKLLLIFITAGLASALSAFAQNPSQTPTNGGWRRFGDAPADQTADVAPAPQPPEPQQEAPDSGFAQRTDPGVPQAPPPTMQGVQSLVIPAGTWITVRMNQPLSSDHNQTGDAFTATLAEPVVVNGLVVARRGQTVGGRVVESHKAGRVEGTSSLRIELTELGIADGQQIPIHTQLIQRNGNTSVGRDAAAIGATTGLGAAIGAGAAGGFGAGMGAIGGAVVSTIGVLVTRGRPTVVYPETELTFRLESPVTITSNYAFDRATQRDYDQHVAYGPGPGPRPAYGYAPRPPVAYYPGYYAAPYPYVYPYWGPSIYFYSGPRFFYGGRFYHR